MHPSSTINGSIATINQDSLRKCPEMPGLGWVFFMQTRLVISS